MSPFSRGEESTSVHHSAEGAKRSAPTRLSPYGYGKLSQSGGAGEKAGTAPKSPSQVREQLGHLFDQPTVDLRRKRYHEYIDDVPDEVTKHSPQD